MSRINDEVFEEVQPNIIVGPDVLVGADTALGSDKTVFTTIDQSGHVITVSTEEVFNAIGKSTP